MPQGYGVALQMHGQLCKPSVDADGGVHLSESRLCPSVGNVVTDSFTDIWSRMRRFRPCGQCAGYRRFMESQRPDIVRARQMIFGEQQTTE
jgi:MoaA/NifB/PqqE/SkfB family radical SAM enzyme